MRAVCARVAHAFPWGGVEAHRSPRGLVGLDPPSTVNGWGHPVLDRSRRRARAAFSLGRGESSRSGSRAGIDGRPRMERRSRAGTCRGGWGPDWTVGDRRWLTATRDITSRSRGWTRPRSRPWPAWPTSVRSGTARPCSRRRAGFSSTSSSRARCDRRRVGRRAEDGRGPRASRVHRRRRVLTDRPAVISAYATGGVPVLLHRARRPAAGDPSRRPSPGCQ